MSPKTKAFLKDGLWVLFGQVLVAAATLASLKVWAVFLLPVDVGLLGLVVGFASILVGVLVGPITQATLISYASIPDEKLPSFRSVASGMVLRQCIIAVMLILAGGVPTAYIIGIPLSMPLLAAGIVIIDGRRAYQISLLSARRRQRQAALVYGGDACFRFIGLWLAMYVLAPSAETALVGTLAGAAVFLIVSTLVLRREGLSLLPSRRTDADISTREAISRLARPLFPSAVLASTTEMFSRYLIAATVGVAAAGIFIISYGLVKRPYGLLNGVTDFTMRPIMAKAVAEGDRERIAHAKLVWLAVGGGLSIVGVVLFYFLKDVVVYVLLSEKYADAADLLPLLALGVALFNIANIFSGFALSAGNSRAVLISNFAGATVGTVLTVLLCLRFGLQGAAWALVIGYFVQLVVSVHTSKAALKRVHVG
ncbi:MAG: polysaccharide biosynthesis C-terminal domain-containing protein [Mesorhizobium sp.]